MEILIPHPPNRKKMWYVGGILIVLLIGGIIYRQKTKSSAFEFVRVGRADITEEVRVTGKIKPATDAHLAFERAGKVRFVGADLGSRVKTGHMLVQLDARDLAAQVSQASAGIESARAQLRNYEAALAAQQAKLQDLINGSRLEDIAAAKADFDKAELDLSNDYLNAPTTIAATMNDADAVVHVKAAGIFIGSRATTYQLSFVSCDTQAAADAQILRLTADAVLDQLSLDVSELQLSAMRERTDQIINNTIARLQTIKQFVEKTNANLITGCALTNSLLDTYRTNMSAAATTINTAIVNVQTLSQTMASHKIAMSKAKSSYDLKVVGNTQQTIDVQRAVVDQAVATIESQRATIKQAQANYANLAAQLAKYTMSAPIDGTITQQDAKVGEIVAANTTIVTIISAQQLEIEANIPEVDVGKVVVGNPVGITIDALPNVTFIGTVSYIDPAETIVDGVVNFRVTIAFGKMDDRFKSGLTANLIIETTKHSDVLVLPQFSIVENDNGTFVRYFENGVAKEKPVKIGIRGSDGMVEILSGVEFGDETLNVGVKTEKK